MTRAEYRAEIVRVRSTAMRPVDIEGSSLILSALGLAGETGEAVDIVKKHLFHGKPLDRDKLILELGDVRWYLESFALALGTTIEEIEERNIAKLRARFPEGFSHSAASAKADERLN